MRLNGGAIQRPHRTASKGQDEVMTEPFVSRGFRGRRQPGATADRLPPGQYETRDFPVLPAGPTPRTSLATWDFTVLSPRGQTARWTWDEFQALPHETVTTDIHCVTKWSKLDPVWEGVSMDTLLKDALARGVELAPLTWAPAADAVAGRAAGGPWGDSRGTGDGGRLEGGETPSART
jgi:DMSO/TMAO reductase YedYZ molybdopterin-dependent catalytic subunit